MFKSISKKLPLLFLCLASIYFSACSEEVIPTPVAPVGNCEQSSIVKSQYDDDACILAIQLAESNNLYSIGIPTAEYEAAMDALMAIYNAVDIPERDTVIAVHNIHNLNYELYNITLNVNSEYAWAQNLINGIIPTGNEYIDNLLASYHFNVDAVIGPVFGMASVQLIAEKPSNIDKLAIAFSNIEGVVEAYPTEAIGNPNQGNLPARRISISDLGTFKRLVFEHAWGDCPAGCLYHRQWTFHVYPNCIVEYQGALDQ